jgi:hypothetical protein
MLITSQLSRIQNKFRKTRLSVLFLIFHLLLFRTIVNLQRTVSADKNYFFMKAYLRVLAL